ncbi:MAG: hypothetical protein COW40_11185 [Cytophagales bacterium CG17_big_fil_post_rev_8_21_14_2_50_40_13]|nr:MAG: hypothetical protein COW40_11185 [Cytophagales bacterium CG17_big_fil_post_rev_8_21_14_2_50_40_13]
MLLSWARLTRKFSELEKKIIEMMIDIHQSDDVLNIMGNIFHSAQGVALPSGVYLYVGTQQDDASFLIEQALAESPDFSKKETRAFKLVASVVTLPRFLEKNAFITLTNSNFDKSKPYFIGEEPEKTTIPFQGVDHKYRADLYRFATSRIFVSEELITFVNNGYKTEDELAKEREVSLLKSQLSFSQKAFWASFIGLLLSVVVLVYQVISIPKMDLQGTAIESISHSLQEMSKKEN